jgi:hypothetical protein
LPRFRAKISFQLITIAHPGECNMVELKCEEEGT